MSMILQRNVGYYLSFKSDYLKDCVSSRHTLSSRPSSLPTPMIFYIFQRWSSYSSKICLPISSAEFSQRCLQDSQATSPTPKPH